MYEKVYAIRPNDGSGHYLIDCRVTPTPEEVTQELDRTHESRGIGGNFTIHGPFGTDAEADEAIEKYSKWIAKGRRQ